MKISGPFKHNPLEYILNNSKQGLRRVIFLVRSLDYGGAESQLLLLAKHLPMSEIDPLVVTFYGQGKLFPQFEQAGIEVLPLNKKGRWDVFPFFFNLMKIIRTIKPDVLYTLLAVPNILGALLKIFFPGIKLVMGVRGSWRDLNQYDWLYRFSFRLEVQASRAADAIIVNSQAGNDVYIRKGFPEAKMHVVHNGFDTDYFHIDRQKGITLRDDWGIPQTTALIGMVGRLDPVKDHPVFLEAAAKLNRSHPDVRFVIIGDGPQDYLRQLQSRAADLGISGAVHWENARQDILSVYNALDILCLSSKGEGFPNVIAEAMACGVPCVATRVGDVPLIVGETGKVVKPESADDLAAALLEMVRLAPEERLRLGQNAAQRIRTFFSVEKLVKDTMYVLDEVAGNR